MKTHLETRNYPNLTFIYKEFEGETHNSEVPLALNWILPELVNQKDIALQSKQP